MKVKFLLNRMKKYADFSADGYKIIKTVKQTN